MHGTTVLWQQLPKLLERPNNLAIMLGEGMTKAQKVLEALKGSNNKLVWPKYTYSFNKEAGSDGKTAVKVDNSAQYSKYKVGDNIAFHAGAPGIGKVVYKITKINDDGVWGIETENTISVPEPDM